MSSVLIVDDHAFFRSAVADLINASEDLQVVGQCHDGSQVAEAVRELMPDVVLMDIHMSKMSGIDAAASLQGDKLAARVLILTSDTAPSTQAAARAAGVAGYLLKGLECDLVLDAIRRVARGVDAWPESLGTHSEIKS